MPIKLLLFTLFALLPVACSDSHSEPDGQLQPLFALLDSEIENSEAYEDVKERRINDLRNTYLQSTDENVRTRIINDLITEFEAYNADSTLYYIALNLHRPVTAANPDERLRMLIKRADAYGHAGLFADALKTISGIPRDSLSPALLETYYATYCALYQYLSEYTSEHESSSLYEQQRALYADSLSHTIPPGTFNHMVHVMAEKARQGETAEAITTLTRNLSRYESGTREYSIIASTLAYIHKIAGDKDKYKQYLTLSAISDARGVVKENMSFRELATVCFEDGDIERANKYLKKSFADANFYSALLRNAQSSKILPVIDGAYSSMQHSLTSRLRIMVWVSSVLSVILVITIIFILRQFKSLNKVNRRLSHANSELSSLSEALSRANAELESRNTELRDFNRTKEQYAGLFMAYCSSAISTLQRYQQSLRVLAAQGGNRTALLKKLESSEMADSLLKNFYVKFDEAILSIYPSFVDKFNALLRPDERIELKTGELLNTELRLFALIRIGIDDSAKIAEFLRCSLATIYTYRSKMRKRAISPDTFETDIKNLA